MLFNSKNDDLSNPIACSYRQMFRKLRTLLILAFAICLMLVFLGVPSIQYTYKAYPTDGTPLAMDKAEADYWNPVLGWRNVRAGELAPGCPFVVFMPLRQCMDLEPYKNTLTSFFFGKEFFDGP